MKKIAKVLPDLKVDTLPLEISSMSEALFMDIETTGFTARGSYLYLIGCIFYRDKNFHLIQWFAESYQEEELVLKSFLEFSEHFSILIHFNGNHFDIPFLVQKASQYSIETNIESKTGIDIYKRLLPLKNFLKLQNLKQKTVETYLGIHRNDLYSGGELITVYHEYVKKPSANAMQLLVLHNEEDIIGMATILPILGYSYLYTEGVTVTKVTANYYTDYNGEEKAELVMKLSCKAPLVSPRVSCYENGCCFIGKYDDIMLKVPIYEEELKYFYSDYKSYYYLPEEDMALHKSVAGYVDPAFREKAKASNCYTRKQSLYLQQFKPTFEPIFKRSYNDSGLFFEITDAFKKDRAGFSKYATEVLQAMISSRNS